jgi:hypothetical protein
MCEIYQRATQVLVWLGPPEDDTDSVMEFLSTVGKEAYEFGLMELTNQQLKNWAEKDETDERRRSIKNSLDSLLERVSPTFPVEGYAALIKRPWYFRVWVVQEVSLGKDVVFMCGRKKISYQHFRAAKFVYTLHTWSIISQIQLPDMMDPEKWRKIEALQSAEASPIGNMFMARRKYQTQAGVKGQSLYTILKMFHVLSSRGIRLRVKDDRDKIFGLLGLATDLEDLGIVPDYSKTCEETYLDAARKPIQNGYVDILALSQFPKKLKGLPSWVPDWSGTIRKPCGEISEAGVPFAASGERKVTVVEIDPNRDTYGSIGMKGMRVDEVERVGNPWTPSLSGKFPLQDAGPFFAEIEEFCKESARRGNQIYTLPQRREEAVWRIPIGDKEFNQGGISFICRATVRSAEGYQGMANGISALKEQPNMRMYEMAAFFRALREDPNLKSYMAMMGDMQNRRPFMTRLGFIGLGPAEMLPTDVICVLMVVLYVLRECRGRGHILVGEAYCDGIMDGEFIEMHSSEETFVLC